MTEQTPTAALAATLPAGLAERFDALFELEMAVRGAKVSVAFCPSATEQYGPAARETALARTKADLTTEFAALGLANLRLYGPYRTAIWAEIRAAEAAR